MLFFLIELLKTWFEVIIACLAVKIFCWRKDPAPVGLPDVRKVCRKVFRWLWKKISGLTIRFYHSIPTWFWDSFKKITTLFTFCYIHSDWCIAQTLFFSRHKLLDEVNFPDTLNMLVKCTENLQKILKEDFQLKTSWRNLAESWAESFQRLLATFLMDWTYMFRVSETHI